MKTIGVMTGNSLDGVDAVLTDFSSNKITDIDAVSLPFPTDLTRDLLTFRAFVKDKAVSEFENSPFFADILDRYTALVAEAVNAIKQPDVIAVGLHGQTCDHCPPSVANGEKPYTLQIFDAQKLADLTDIPVIYDFRSDDMMNGGEGAPLAPAHNEHIAADLRDKGFDCAAFCNAGNTGNIAVIAGDTVLGWDVGAFNHFADKLTREYKGVPCDKDGQFGQTGQLRPDFLQTLFDTAAITKSGENFYTRKPPKSSDPSWYVLPDSPYPFADTLRTVEYLSAYAFFHTLSFIPETVPMPQAFLTFGGGWKNPLCVSDFKALLNGTGFVLPCHRDLFAQIRARFAQPPVFAPSENYGYSGTYMEARIFADAAYSKIVGRPFTFPATTGCKSPTVAGIFCLPATKKEYLISAYLKTPDLWDKKVSRAAKGLW